MSLLSSRRRKLLYAAAALAATGYASYSIYTSDAFRHRRKRLLQILNTLSFCCEAVSQSSESFSILSSDIKAFLLSDDDTVPQSLKQAFKIGQSEELQESLTVLSAALARGLARGISAKPRKDVFVRGHGHGQFAKPSLQGHQENDTESEDVACREIREVSFTTKGQERPRVHGPKECILFPKAEKCQEWEIKSYSSGSDMHVQRSRRVGVVFDRSRRPKPPQDLWEKLLSKLFSEPGIDFASAVTGTFAKNLILAFFETSRIQSSSGKNTAPSSSSNYQHTTSQTNKESVPTYAKAIDVVSTNQCRALIAECMQTFISTAVTVYVDKTKDVNFYDDMVAGITNPSHKDSMKEMLTSVCNGAIETLVRTSYEVLRDGQEGASKCHQQAGKSKCEIQEYSSFMPIDRQGNQEEGNDTQREALTSYRHPDTQGSPWVSDMGMPQGNDTGGVQNLIHGVSKTLAIPSNRKLIVDVAGTMTSEAVRSFMNVVVSTASSHISSKMHGSWDMLRKCVSNDQGLQLQERSRDMAAKAFVFASVCLAICLHILVGSQFLQT